MKKRYFTIIIAIALGTAIGYLIPTPASAPIPEPMDATTESNTDKKADPVSTTSEASKDTVAPPVVNNKDEVMFTISLASLSPAQLSIVKALGVDGDEIVVTQSRYACATQKVSETRLLEMKDGASPSLSEGIALLGCM